MSDLISRQDAIKVVEEERFPVDSDYAEGFMAALDKVGWILKEWLPSAEKAQLSEEDATKDATSDLISRKEAIDEILSLTNCDTVEKLRAYVIEHDLGSWRSGGVLSSIGKVEQLPSAEQKTPSNGSITCVKSEKMHDRTMGDLISRQDAIIAVRSHRIDINDPKKIVKKSYEDVIRELPSAPLYTPDEIQTMQDLEWSQMEKMYELGKAGSNWISCKERVPESYVDVLVWFEYYRYGSYNRLYQTYGIGTYSENYDSWTINHESGWHKLRVIAWQPLPEPYKKEGDHHDD